jgi:hypothetical protein
MGLMSSAACVYSDRFYPYWSGLRCSAEGNRRDPRRCRGTRIAGRQPLHCVAASPACASALKGDPTPSVYQGLDFSMRIPVSVGSRSAPMGTPLYCSFRGLIRVLNQTKKGSHFGTELQLCAKKASLHGKGGLCTKSLRFFERGRLATGKSFGARRHQRHRHDRDPGLPRYLNATHPVGSCGYQWLGGSARRCSVARWPR